MRAQERQLPFLEPLAVAVDVVVLTVAAKRLQVLLSRRKRAPFAERWSLPGGFVGAEESAEEAAVRELAQKTSVRGMYLEQLYTFSDPARDPRTRVVSIAYYALVPAAALAAEGGARESRWFDIRGERATLGGAEVELAFDHRAILETALRRVRGKLTYAPIGFQLLPERFTLTELQEVYEAILEHPADKRNFRRKVLASGVLAEAGELRTGAHRPAKLYRFPERTF